MMALSKLQLANIYDQGKQFGVKSALIGSVVFSFIDLIGVYVNSYIIQHQKIVTDSWVWLFDLIWLVVIAGLGCAMSYFPARIFGGLLARLLENDYTKQKLTKRIALAKGGFIGGLTGFLVCLPIVIAEYISIHQTGHGDFDVFVYRTGMATMIAALAGAWSGAQIEKILAEQAPANAVVV